MNRYITIRYSLENGAIRTMRGTEKAFDKKLNELNAMGATSINTIAEIAAIETALIDYHDGGSAFTES